MSLQAMDWALRKVRGLSPTQKLILICLGNHAGPDGNCWPSQSVISEYTELSRETINRNLSELEKKGIIRSVHRQDDAGRDLSKTYFLNMDSPGVTADHTGMSNPQGGETEDHTYKNQEPSEHKQENAAKMLGVMQNHTGVTESHRGCDAESHTGVTEDHTSKEKQSRKESVKRTNRRNTPVEIAKSAIDDPPAALDLPTLWRTHCPSLPQIREMTQKRKEKIRFRLAEHSAISWWVAVMTMIEKSRFCRGNNRSGWRATFDWLIENPDNAIKVLEGKYSGPNGNFPKENFDFDVERWAREE
jgi:biotin operon repressor